jgi:hypothetical protein
MVDEGSHRIVEVADHVVESDPPQADWSLEFLAGQTHQQDGFVGLQNVASVLSEPATEANVDRSSQVRDGEIRGFAGIEHHRHPQTTAP